MVRLYIARACFDEDGYRAALALCSEKRREKISTLREEADRHRSLAAAVALDHALKSVGLCAASGAVAEMPTGKPYLPEHPNVHFSLSHAGGYAVCAIADRLVGADVERERSFSESVKCRCFCAEELAAAPPLRLWVLKESYGKMTGRGIAVMDTAQLVFEGTIHARENGEVQRAAFWDDTLPNGYRIAVCCEGEEPFTPELILI